MQNLSSDTIFFKKTPQLEVNKSLINIPEIQFQFILPAAWSLLPPSGVCSEPMLSQVGALSSTGSLCSVIAASAWPSTCCSSAFFARVRFCSAFAAVSATSVVSDLLSSVQMDSRLAGFSSETSFFLFLCPSPSSVEQHWTKKDDFHLAFLYIVCIQQVSRKKMKGAACHFYAVT